MKKEIFREKSLDRVKSPESLDDYIRVSNPGVWLLLVSVIVLLAGAVVWATFGHVDSTIPVTVAIKDNVTVCIVAEENIESVKEGMIVEFADTEAVVTAIGEKNEMGYTCNIKPATSMPDGFYEGKLITKSFKPLSFILN